MPLKRSILIAAVSLLGCGHRPALPAPTLPLVTTPDAPFRAHRPEVNRAAAARSLQLPTVASARLSNGFVIWAVTQRQLPYVALSYVAADAGTAYAGSRPELVQFMVRSLVEGGTFWIDGRAADRLEVNGEAISFAVSPSHSVLSLDTPPAGIDSAVTVLGRTVRYPFWANGALDPVRLNELTAMRENADSVSHLLLGLTASAALGEDVALSLLPMRMTEIRKATIADVQACHAQVMRPASGALIAVGDVTLAELTESAERAFGTWQPQASAPVMRGDVRHSLSDGRRLHLLRGGGDQQADVLIAQPAPNTAQLADELPFAVLTNVVAAPLHSRSERQLRHDAGLTYGVRPQLLRTRNWGIFSMEAAFESSETRAAIMALLATIEAVRKQPVSAAELEQAKQDFAVDLARRTAGNRALADYLGQLFAEGKNADWLQRIPEQLAALSAPDLQRVARLYLSDIDVEVGVTGDLELARELSFIGHLETYQADAQ